MALIRLPGLIDPHVHLRDLGQEHKEDFTTGTAAALAGGFTTIIDMPNNPDPITTLEKLKNKQKIAQEKVLCDVGFYFGTLGDNFDEFEKVKDHVKGLKIYLNPTTGNFLLDKHHLAKIFEAWPKELPILFHAENETFDDVLEIVKENPRKIHLCHMSTEYELRKVIAAKERGLPVTCGVTPHHLFLNEIHEQELGGFGKMKPPLSKVADVTFLWEHLDAVDMIETDHAPHTFDEKEKDPPAYGIPGLETVVPLFMTAINQNKLTVDDLKRLCHNGPAKTFDITQDTETYTLIDPDEEWTIENKDMHTKAGWTPFAGWKAVGRVKEVVIRGTKVFADGKILIDPGFGKTRV